MKSKNYKCHECHGKGEYNYPKNKWRIENGQVLYTCQTCEGTGKFEPKTVIDIKITRDQRKLLEHALGGKHIKYDIRDLWALEEKGLMRQILRSDDLLFVVTDEGRKFLKNGEDQK